MKAVFRNRFPLAWRVDPDGVLRITMRVLQEGVYDYSIDEVPDMAEFRGADRVRELISANEFTADAIASLEGKSVIVDQHSWRHPENALRDGLTVGNVAGRPYVKDGGLYCDAVILDPSAIEAITNPSLSAEQRLVEVSAGYDGNLEVESGEFNGRQYDAKQTELRFNHILLLPAGKGRCGPDVRIINSSLNNSVETGEKAMAEKQAVLTVKFGNATRTFRFANKEDQEVAEQILDEERRLNADQLQAAMDAKRGLESQIAELQKQVEEHNKLLLDAKLQIEELLSLEKQEEMAAEVAEQGDEEVAIVAALAGDEAKKEKVLDDVRITNGKRVPLADRRKNIVGWALKERGAEVPASWSQDAFDAAFEVLAMETRIQNSKARASSRTENGKLARIGNEQAPSTNRDRMLRPMRLTKEAK